MKESEFYNFKLRLLVRWEKGLNKKKDFKGYFLENRQSLINKIYGLYQYEMGEQTYYLLVMKNQA
jgi:arginine/ornithine N-succinyltransferase beta subunit